MRDRTDKRKTNVTHKPTHKPRHTPKRTSWAYILAGMVVCASVSVSVAVGGVQAQVRNGPHGGEHTLVLSRVRHYLNSLYQFTARFAQFTDSGGFASGRLSVLRPGKMRVEYDPPVSLEIVADGQHVFFYDSARDTVNSTSLANFPAGFLLERYIDFGGRFSVINIETRQRDIVLNVRDKNQRDIGDIQLLFHDRPLRLAQWVIRDARGVETRVSLSDIRKVQSFDPDLFYFRRPSTRPFSPFKSRRR